MAHSEGQAERSCHLSPPPTGHRPPPMLTETKNTLLSPRGCQPSSSPAQPGPVISQQVFHALGRLGSRVLQPEF